MTAALRRGVVIEVRCNEYASRDANGHVPWSPEEIARDAAACEEAGASIVHFHTRDPATGAPAHDAAATGAVIRAIRESTDLLVMPTLGAVTVPDPAERIRPVIELARDPAARPDLVPIDLGSFNIDPYDPTARRFGTEDLVYATSVRDLRALVERTTAAGMRPMAALWNVGSARLLGAFMDQGVLAGPAYAQVTLSDRFLSTHPVTVDGLDALVRFLPAGHDVVWSVLGVGADLRDVARAAVRSGGHVAIGLGDHAYGELGEPTNAELVDAVAALVREEGRHVAAPDEARALLGLPC